MPEIAVCVEIISSCSDSYDRDIQYALDLAGDNRTELEQVLEHYSDEPEKLAAARFLIENMPGHYSYADTTAAEKFYDSLDSLIETMTDCDRSDLQKAIVNLYKERVVANFAIDQDVRLRCSCIIGTILLTLSQSV